ncbi:pseudouridine-5'-phosphate glycosidase [Marinivivus vitaminiproducens]|uniref:pseudouridine-5'-phosphate glycosidase n=1 Tax=Marinivivus vitaminiproducens TaxID=3035935 RepID=UPI0027A2D0D3|nr:pseudouridine-5'-phosphate glycosidase [Geminicoccaceae bacterium SCSIO 64248]
MPFRIRDDVAHAMEDGRGVVALETTLICHGLPRPGNRAFAHRLEEVVRQAGAVPATIGVLDGAIRVGLTAEEIDRIATADDVLKASTRELAFAVATGRMAATTVASTIHVAGKVGISIMATGGLGGVHRGGESSLDVSADLGELARQPVAVVCAGAKIILDLARTLEVLESLSVPVLGLGTGEFPGFYTAETGLPVRRVDGIEELARLVHAQRAIDPGVGIVVAQKPPAELALSARAAEALVSDAIAAARSAKVTGAAETPYVLAHMAERSRGTTVALNEALVLENARVAAELAAVLARTARP